MPFTYIVLFVFLSDLLNLIASFQDIRAVAVSEWDKHLMIVRLPLIDDASRHIIEADVGPALDV